jgi:hypothetical protein
LKGQSDQNIETGAKTEVTYCIKSEGENFCRHFGFETLRPENIPQLNESWQDLVGPGVVVVAVDAGLPMEVVLTGTGPGKVVPHHMGVDHGRVPLRHAVEPPIRGVQQVQDLRHKKKTLSASAIGRQGSTEKEVQEKLSNKQENGGALVYHWRIEKRPFLRGRHRQRKQTKFKLSIKDQMKKVKLSAFLFDNTTTLLNKKKKT